MSTYIVKVQHPCIELQDGSVIPNFITIGTVQAGDGEDALLAAQTHYGRDHCPALLTVEPKRR